MPPAAVETYLAGLSPEKRRTLEAIRLSIASAAPSASEAMSYGVPAFVSKGRAIAGYSASANHCSYHPMSGTIVTALRAELAPYKTSKGTIRFPVGRPLPSALIARLVRARLDEIG